MTKKRRERTAADVAGRSLTSRVGVTSLEGGAATLLEVRAQPGARRAGFAGFWNGLAKIAVSAPPENGRANAEIAAQIAALFGLRASAVELASGPTSRLKRFRLACAPSVVAARLSELEAGAAERPREPDPKRKERS